MINQSINQSKHISIAPYVASESEVHMMILDSGLLFLGNLYTNNTPTILWCQKFGNAKATNDFST